jgi:hypothetical protein
MLTCVSHNPGFTGELCARKTAGATNNSNPTEQPQTAYQARMAHSLTSISLRIKAD